MSKSITPVKISKEFYTEKLLPAFVNYRDRMSRICKVKGTYSSIYTEKRSHGLRTKFWDTRNSFPISKLKAYVRQHDVLEVGKLKFKVTVKQTTVSVYRTHSVEVHFTQSN